MTAWLASDSDGHQLHTANILMREVHGPKTVLATGVSLSKALTCGTLSHQYSSTLMPVLTPSNV